MKLKASYIRIRLWEETQNHEAHRKSMRDDSRVDKVECEDHVIPNIVSVQSSIGDKFWQNANCNGTLACYCTWSYCFHHQIYDGLHKNKIEKTNKIPAHR